MDLVTPGIGMIFWTSIIFLVLLFLLRKFAWKPIMKAVHKREGEIEKALHAAEKAREDMKALEFNNEKLLKEAKNQKDIILKEAREMKDAIIEEAKENANIAGERILKEATEKIHFEKMAAITELKNQLAQLSIEIAEKVLKEELVQKEKQQKLIEGWIDDINFN
jgi:F-type H+-transporting ATPase subunit b